MQFEILYYHLIYIIHGYRQLEKTEKKIGAYILFLKY